MVAIVVPASVYPLPTADEQISLRHLLEFLGPYDKFVLAPRGRDYRLEGLRTLEISPKFFGSATAYGRLLYRPDFFRMFEDYRYVLVYHLDALVFRDELRQWCETDFDYIGAPWIRCTEMPWVKEPAVGNGGFTLMKIETSLKVLHHRYQSEPARYWEDRSARLIERWRQVRQRLRGVVPKWLRGPMTRSVRERLQRFDGIEVNRRANDLFWSFSAVKYFPEFRLPDWRTGLRFAFEAPPRRCFELNNHQLPFGCHAWTKYDRAFWEPYLLP